MATNERKTQAAAIEAEVDVVSNVLVLRFGNGQVIEINADTLSEATRRQALLHGLKQKLVDAAAISRDPETGRTATVETKYAAVREVADRLLTGEWNKKRGDGSGAGVTGGLLFRALCRMYGERKSPEDVRAFLAGKSAEEQAALRKHAKVAAIIEEIKAERAAGSGTAADSDELLAGLEG